jgi:ASF1 like histone chaperone
MSLVNVINVTIDNNPASFQSPIVLNIRFECLKPLDDEIEWKYPETPSI